MAAEEEKKRKAAEKNRLFGEQSQRDIQAMQEKAAREALARKGKSAVESPRGAVPSHLFPFH